MRNDKKDIISNLNMIRIGFVDPVTKEQRKLIDDTFDNVIKIIEEEMKNESEVK